MPSSKSMTYLLVLSLLSGIVHDGRMSPAAQSSNDAPGSVGKPIADFTLKDASGRPVSLVHFKDKKAVAVIFLGTQCPINNLYLPRLAELHKEFAAKDVALLAINSNHQDGFSEMARHAKKNELPFPVLHDEGNVIADRFGAQRTPEAFVLDERRVVRYQGRIDDQVGFDFQRRAPTRRDLAEAVAEVLEGKKVTVSSTAVAGCIIGRVRKTRAEGPVTFTKHIAPLLQNHCQTCHRAGQIGPMPLLEYDDVVSWSGMIREVVADGRMPPWYADPKHGKFSNDRSLPADQRDLLLAWIDNGMAKGDVKDLPPPAKFPEGWQIGTPDLVLSIPNEFDVPAEMPKFGIKYQHFWIDLKLDEDKWVERAEARPGAPEVVHHILAFIVPPGARFIPGNPATPVLCGMAPGESPLILPQGMAKLVPKGSRIVFQVHYTPNGRAQKDRSSIALVFAKRPPDKMVITRPVYNEFFRIPPGADNHEVQSAYVLPKDGYIISMMPHMHLRGKDFLIKTVAEDGTTVTRLAVPRFNFNWQSIYRPVEPIPMPKGSKVVCVAHFDNSRNNPSNPDPERNVYWGDQTWQEMMIGWMDFAYDMAPQVGKKGPTITLKDGKAKVAGELKTDDDKDKVQKQPCKVFTVEFKSGQNYKIDMVSKEIDSYLRLEDPAGKELAKDDDGGGLVNARINFHCRVDGTYRVICTTFAGGTGPFTLTIQETAVAKAGKLDLKDGLAKVEAKLTAMDAADAVQTRSVCKIYEIKLAKGKSYQIDMMSKDVDSYLRLENSAGKELAKDDDGGGGRNARIRFECPEDGEYRIFATTYFGGTGSFSLTVKEK